MDSIVKGGAILLLLAGCHSLRAAGEESVAKTTATRLAWEVEPRKSVEIRVRYEIIPSESDPTSPMVYDAIEDYYIESATGQRVCDSRHFNKDVNVNRYTYYDNGNKCADVSYSEDDLDHQRSVLIKRQYWMEDYGDRKQLPIPLLWLYVGRKPLQEALLKAEYLGDGEALGRPCRTFLFVGVQWNVPQDHVYFLDEKTAIPLKVESYTSKEAREKNEPQWIWMAKTLDEVQGHFIPTESIMTSYSDDHSPVMTWEYHVLSIKFGADYAPTMFWPVIQPGVYVVDAITQKSYRTPGPGPRTSPVQPEDEKVARSIQARPPSGWLPMLQAGLLVSGLGIVVMGLALWWRRR